MKDPRQRLRHISGARLLLEETPGPTASRAKAPWIVAATLAIVALSVFWMAWRATRTSEHPLMQVSVDFGGGRNPRAYHRTPELLRRIAVSSIA
jgi:hypothetical protein